MKNALDRVRRYLREVPPAVQGNGGDGHTHRVVCKVVRGFAVSAADALPLLLEWNQSCVPPWSTSELAGKIANALKNGKEPIGGRLDASRPRSVRQTATSRTDDPPTMPVGRLDAADHNLARVSTTAWHLVERSNQPPQLLRHAGVLVRIEETDAQPQLKPMMQDAFRHELARRIEWYVTVKRRDGSVSEKAAYPPMAVVRDMLATPAPPVPTLHRLVTTPVFDPAGRLITTRGFDPPSGLLYTPPPSFALPYAVQAQPDRAAIDRARRLLVDELLGEFPFENNADKAHALALALQPFARALIDGPTPLYLIEKAMPGAGATLLAQCATLLASGVIVPAMTLGRDDDELRKRLSARLLSSPHCVLIDNVRRLDSETLAMALTSAVWEDRLLGATQLLRLPLTCTWVATGINPTLSAEITRRTMRIRLAPEMERPWLRSGFRHPDLRGWTSARRGELVWAALTLVQAWIASGRPDGSADRLGMFEAWTRVMSGILDTCGVPGFLCNLAAFYEASDNESRTLAAFVSRWWNAYGDREVGVADLWRLLTPPAGDPMDLNLGGDSEASQRIRLGKKLGQLRDRVFDGRKILDAGSRQRAQQWKLKPVASGRGKCP